MISQTVEYALRAVVDLADHAGTPRTTQQIADRTKVPHAYLSKVLQGLVRQGIVKSQRGLKGGMSLVNTPEELSILDVVNAVDPIQRIHTCPLGISSHGNKLCALHKKLDAAAASLEEAFRDVTLANVLSDPSAVNLPLCADPSERIVQIELS